MKADLIFPILVSIYCIGCVTAQGMAEEDEITNLPGLNHKINFKHYSGFLQTSSTHHLHYWLTESQSDPDKDPLVIWFNGGPGCSSLLGLLSELGPYWVDGQTKNLKENPDAWNKFANTLFLESPAGVGFSYSADANTKTSDDQTTEENYVAIKQIHAKFPAYRNRSLFITGESYAGKYIPMLADRILKGQKDYPIKLAGVAIGNGLLSVSLNDATLLTFSYAHGLVDEELWKKARAECCGGCVETCEPNTLNQCPYLQDIMPVGDPYNMYEHCGTSSRVLSFIRAQLLPGWLKGGLKNHTFTSQQPGCNEPNLAQYLNDAQVQKALHVTNFTKEWAECGGIAYYSQYDDMDNFVKNITNGGVRVLLFYGDHDTVCNFLMGQQFSDRLGYKEVERKQPWSLHGRIAGFKTIYENNLTFITVMGAGHMAPEWRAPEVHHAIKHFINDKPI